MKVKMWNRLLGVEPVDQVDHLGHGLSGLDSPLPRLSRILEVTQRLRDRARSNSADRVTRHAAGGLDEIHPLGLTREVVRHVFVSVCARELALIRDL